MYDSTHVSADSDRDVKQRLALLDEAESSLFLNQCRDAPCKCVLVCLCTDCPGVGYRVSHLEITLGQSHVIVNLVLKR